MGLETATYISDLDETWPLGGDNPNKGDDHLRVIKEVIKNTFPNINGAMTLTDEELNALLGHIHTALAITNTPAGDIEATNVQDAINELDTEKEPADSTILKDADIGVTILAYAARVLAGEITAGTETTLKTYSPADIVSFITQHAPDNGIGTGQTTTNVIGSRSAGVTYTNSTGKPIEVSIAIYRVASSGAATLTVDGVVKGMWSCTGTNDVGTTQTISVIVPDGSTYRLSSGGASYWAELR